MNDLSNQATQIHKDLERFENQQQSLDSYLVGNTDGNEIPILVAIQTRKVG